MDILKESENPPKRECLLTAAGSQEVNGSYTQTSEEDLFYKKKYTAGDPAGIVYIITLESLPELGEDFEVAWALQSHDTVSDEVVTFYATPCDEPEAQGFPLKGWITISGLEPVPRIFPRPVQLPRDRASNLDIIVENLEQDFPIEPFWAENQNPQNAVDEEDMGMFDDWDEFRDDEEEVWRDNNYEEPSSEGEDSDYGEVELPDDIMANFQDGHFVHKHNPVDNSVPDERAEAVSPLGNDVDSDTSEDNTVVRHDANRDSLYDQSEASSKSLVSGQVDEKEEVEEEDEGDAVKVELPPQRRMESGACTDRDYTETSEVDLKNPQLAYARSQGKEGEITIVDLRTEPPSISGARIGSLVMRHARVGSGQQDEIDFRVISSPYKPLIAPPKDPFISSKSRTGRDPVDVDLIEGVKSPRRKSGRVTGSNESQRRKSQRKQPGKRSQNNEIPTNNNGVGDEEKEAKLSEVTTEKVTQTKTEEKTDINVSSQSESKRDPQREKLEEEMHQLKTKMRKCDRLSKLRKRGRTLSKEQQETLVHKSKYQKRIEELRKELGSDIGKS